MWSELDLEQMEREENAYAGFRSKEEVEEIPVEETPTETETEQEVVEEEAVEDASEEELYEQIGRLKMELEWLKKKAAEFE